MQQSRDPIARNNLSPPREQGLLVIDGQGRLTTCSTRARELLALSPEDAKPGTPLIQILHNAQMPDFLPADGSSSGSILTGLNQADAPGWRMYEQADGKILLWLNVPLPNVGIAIFLADASDAGTDRNESQPDASDARTIASESSDSAAGMDRRHFAELFDAVGEAIITVDSHYTITDFNREAARLFGYRADEVIGRPLDMLLPAQAKSAHRAHISEFAGSDDERRFIGHRPSIRGRRKDGTEFSAEGSISKIAISGEMIFTAVLRDITELLRAKTALQQSEQRFRDIAEIASDAIWETDADFRITYASGAGRDRKRVPDADFLGKTRWEFVGVAPFSDHNWAQHKATLEARRPFRNFRYSARDALGDQQHYSVSGFPIFDESGAFVGFRGVTAVETETMAALSRAQQAENLLRDAIESISEGFVIFDKDDRFITCNKVYRQMYPDSADFLVPGNNFSNILRASIAKGQYPDAVGFEDEWLAERLRRHRELSGSVEHRLRTGRYVMVREQRMENGGTAGLRMDITALKQAENSLRASERRFKDIADVSGDWIWETDSNNRVVYVGGGSGRAGFSDAFLRGKMREDIAAGDQENDPAWVDHVATLKAHRPYRNFVFRALGDEGLAHFLRISGTPIFDEEGAFSGYRGTATDITSDVELRRDVDRKTNLLQTTFETMGEGILVVDEEIRILAFNKRLFSLLGVSPTSMAVGDPVDKLLRLYVPHLEDSNIDVDKACMEELTRISQLRSGHSEKELRNGTIFEIHDRPLMGGGLVRSYRDITMQKRVENELRAIAIHAQRASDAKSEFIACMSHELRTPLNAIIGFSELMRNGVLGPLGNKRYQSYTDDIHESAMNLLSIINRILAFSAFESGRATISEKPVAVSEIIQEAAEDFQHQAKQKGLCLSIDCQKPSTYVSVDVAKFRMVLTNLISNAVKFTPDGGEISITWTSDRAAGFLVSVKDTGIGMEPEEIPIALEPFRQLDGRLNRKYQGTGLGLPLAKQIIELHGGSLTLDSTRGLGTTVTVRLPPNRVTTGGLAP